MIAQIADMSRALEQVTIVSPLGIRFWDVALAVPVDNGLIVTAWPPGTRDMAARAVKTPSGIYAFNDLPGLNVVEYPSGDISGASPPGAKRFTVEVIDMEGRFLPAAFSVDLPYRGIFPLGTTNSGPPGLYLFSAPARPPSSSLATVRGQLSEQVSPGVERPGAYAVLQIDTPDNGSWFGVADERGAVSVMFPYPTFTGAPGGSPSSASPRGVSQQRWEIRIEVRYAPSALTMLDGAHEPDLRSIFNQSPGVITTTVAVSAGQPADHMVADLVFGQTLVLRTDQRSALIINPAASP